MTTLVKLSGIFLLILVGYHTINEPLGFSVAGSVAIVVFAGCLLAVYRGYAPDGKNWVGWSLIAAGCLLLSTFESFSFWLLAPAVLVLLGFKLTELTIELPPGNGGCHGGDGGGGFGDFGDSGGDGGGD